MILLVNGPNLNLLGEREPDVYGSATLEDVERLVSETCARYGVEVKAFQSNSEGAILDFIQAYRHEARGIIVNPGALTHTSYALHDCLKSVPVPAVEIHISNVHAREPWRRTSVISPAVAGQIAGLGVHGYWLAAMWLCEEVARVARSGAGETRRAVPPTRGATGAQPGPGHEGSSGASAWAARAKDLTGSGEGPEEIPVDRSKRGDYEPL